MFVAIFTIVTISVVYVTFWMYRQRTRFRHLPSPPIDSFFNGHVTVLVKEKDREGHYNSLRLRCVIRQLVRTKADASNCMPLIILEAFTFPEFKTIGKVASKLQLEVIGFAGHARV